MSTTTETTVSKLSVGSSITDQNTGATITVAAIEPFHNAQRITWTDGQVSILLNGQRVYLAD